MTTVLPELKAPFVRSDADVMRAAFVVPPSAGLAAVHPVHGESNAIVERAREQFTVFANRLVAAGVKCAVPESEAAGASSLCADIALLFPEGAFVMRPSDLRRRGEVAAVEAALARAGIPIVGRIEAPGLLDGGDVLRVGDTVFIGVPRQRRAEVGIPAFVHGNALGREQLAAYARSLGRTVVEIAMNADVLRLRSVAAALDAETVLYAPGVIDGSVFAGLRTFEAPRGEDYGAGRLDARAATRARQRALPPDDAALAQSEGRRRIDRPLGVRQSRHHAVAARARSQAGIVRFVRIAIVSDIHGNLRGLDACLADLAEQGGADAIVAAGDYCMDGPQPAEVIDRLIALGALCVRGNTDRVLADAAFADEHDEELRWYRERIGETRLGWLRDLPFSRSFGDGADGLLVVHANPKTDDEHIWPDASDEFLERITAGVRERTIAFGHLHLPYARVWRDRLFIDVASAGLPKDGDPRAGYALLTQRSGGWQVKHRRVPFDVERVARDIAKCGMPDAARRIRVLRRHRYKQLDLAIP